MHMKRGPPSRRFRRQSRALPSTSMLPSVLRPSFQSPSTQTVAPRGTALLADSPHHAQQPKRERRRPGAFDCIYRCDALDGSPRDHHAALLNAIQLPAPAVHTPCFYPQRHACVRVGTLTRVRVQMARGSAMKACVCTTGAESERGSRRQGRAWWCGSQRRACTCVIASLAAGLLRLLSSCWRRDETRAAAADERSGAVGAGWMGGRQTEQQADIRPPMVVHRERPESRGADVQRCGLAVAALHSQRAPTAARSLPAAAAQLRARRLEMGKAG